MITAVRLVSSFATMADVSRRVVTNMRRRSLRSAMSQDANPSGFTAHRETGNPEAARVSPTTSPVPVRTPSGKALVGQGGETSNLFIAARQRRADAFARTLGRVSP